MKEKDIPFYTYKIYLSEGSIVLYYWSSIHIQCSVVGGLMLNGWHNINLSPVHIKFKKKINTTKSIGPMVMFNIQLPYDHDHSGSSTF